MSERLRIIDSHVHFWNPSALEYSWLDQLPSLSGAHVPSQYPGFVDGSVGAVVVVEANAAPARNADEIAMIERWAADEPRIAGFVAYVDLLDASRRDAQLSEFRTRKSVVGVRHNIQGNVPGFCTQPEFVRGVERVGDAGFPFDVCATADQLRDVYELVEQCDGTHFVLDHCGKPAVDKDDFHEWAKSAEAIARFPNVTCKVSGLMTQALHGDVSDDVLIKYARHIVGCFQPTRLMFGTDWPVCTLSGDTNRWRTIVETVCTSWSLEDRQLMFADNAQRIYKLAPHLVASHNA